MKAVLPGGAAVLFVLYKMMRNRQYWLGLALSVFVVWGYGCCGQAMEDEELALSLVERLTGEGESAEEVVGEAAETFSVSAAEDLRERLAEEGRDRSMTGSEVSAVGVLASLTPKEKTTQALLEDVILRTSVGTLRVKKLFVYLQETAGIAEGDRIAVIGSLSCFDAATNPGQFDYRAYQAAHGVYLLMYGKEAGVAEASVRPLDRWLGRVRRYACDIFLDVSPGGGGTMAAMVLGDKTNLPEERYQLYLDTGIGHILTLSGLHLSLLGVGFYGFLRKKVTIPTWPAAVVMTGLLLLYVRLIGSGMSAMRAMVAILCSILAGCLGKTYDSLSAAGLGMFLILTEYPMQICRPAFWLSFGAVFAMGGILPELNRFLKPKRKSMKAAVSVLVIWLALMPVTAVNQYVIQPYSLLLNFVVVPMMGPVLIACIAVLCLGMVAPVVSSLVAVPVEAAFWAMDRLCELTLKLPGSQVVVGAPTYWQLMIYYALLAGFLLLVMWQNRREWEAQETAEYGEVQMGVLPAGSLRGKPVTEKGGQSTVVEPNRFLRWSGLIGLCVVLVCVLLLGSGRNQLEMVFLDVGQGDCICIRMPDGTTMVVDGGSTSEEQVGEYRILPCLTWAGIDRIDYLVITHLDEDHTNGLMELLQSGFSVKYLLVSEITTKWDRVELIREISCGNGVKVVMIGENDRIKCGNVEIDCIAPAKTLQPDSENEASVVLELTYRNFSCLLTGDVEGEGEQMVEDYVRERPAYTLLKVAHHGSKYSTSEAFLTAVDPKTAVISCGQDNSYGHPHAELLDRLETAGCEIFCTADCGAVMVETDGVRWKIYGYADGDS